MKPIKRIFSLMLAVCVLSFSGVTQAASKFSVLSNESISDLPGKVVSELELTSGVTISEEVTRAQFAKLLLNASSYQGTAAVGNTYAIFTDVPSDHTYFSAICTAANEGWMTAYLDGTFRPDQPITLREALNAMLALLGYESSDFTGTQTRTALYSSTGLLDNVTKELDGTLSSGDCTTLLYNLMKASGKSGQTYGALFDCQLDSDGEIDYLALLETHNNKIIGPVEVDSDDLDDVLPFSSEKATVFVDGESSRAEDINEGDYLFYSTKTRTVWAYSENVEYGTVTGIGYDIDGSLLPTALYVDGTAFLLETDKMRYAFSNSSVRVGDEVTVIYDTQESTGDEENTNILRGYIIEN